MEKLCSVRAGTPCWCRCALPATLSNAARFVSSAAEPPRRTSCRTLAQLSELKHPASSCTVPRMSCVIYLNKVPLRIQKAQHALSLCGYSSRTALQCFRKMSFAVARSLLSSGALGTGLYPRTSRRALLLQPSSTTMEATNRLQSAALSRMARERTGNESPNCSPNMAAESSGSPCFQATGLTLSGW